MINLRNLLCVKRKNELDVGERILYEPYKNILQNLNELTCDVEAKDFDPVAKVYDGLLSVPTETRHYYEALLGVTSYYQHSQGGRGRYIEKKIASAFSSCSLDIKLSELPIWLEHPEIHKRRGIFTTTGLADDEKRMLRSTEWDWMGSIDENTDLGSILSSEKTIVLMEVKNRVDSGGSSARREIWTSQKFGIILDYLINNNKLFRKGDSEFSLAELLKYFGIEKLELYIGILFDIGDSPASIEVDRTNGFYSTSKEGFIFSRNKLRSNTMVTVQSEDDENLQIEALLPAQNLYLKLGAVYGNSVTQKLFREDFPVSDLLLLKYDDMWLSQLLSIDERASLLKNGKNYTTLIVDLLRRDFDLRMKYNALLNSECGQSELDEVIAYVMNNHSSSFSDDLLPLGRDKEGYLADVVQVLCATEA